VEDFGRYLFMVLLAPNPATLLEDELAAVELDICMGANWVMTYHTGGRARLPRPGGGRAAAQLPPTCSARGRPSSSTGWSMAWSTTTSRCWTCSTTRPRSWRPASSTTTRRAPPFGKMLALKRNVLHLRRIVLPHREMISKVLHEDYPLLSEGVLVYFRDVADHLARIVDQVEL